MQMAPSRGVGSKTESKGEREPSRGIRLSQLPAYRCCASKQLPSAAMPRSPRREPEEALLPLNCFCWMPGHRIKKSDGCKEEGEKKEMGWGAYSAKPGTA